MQAKAKSNSVVTHRLDDTTGIITFVVLGGKGGGANAEFHFDPKRVGEANLPRFLRNGIVQRVVDSAALSTDTATGKRPSPQEKAEKLGRVVAHYMSGSDEWSAARVDGGTVLDGVLLAAVAEAMGLQVDAARVKVIKGAEGRGITPKEFLAHAATSDRVIPIVARMRAERAGVSADDLIAEMEEEGEGEDKEE